MTPNLALFFRLMAHYTFLSGFSLILVSYYAESTQFQTEVSRFIVVICISFHV